MKDKKELKKLLDIIKEDDLGQLDSPSGDDLPRPIASKVVEEMTERNILRKLFPSITVPKSARNLTIPTLTYDSNNVKTIGYGTSVTSNLDEQTFATGSVILTPRLLVAYVDLIEDDLETASVDLAKWIRQTLTHKLAEAEELAMLKGTYTSGTQTYDKVFDGINTIAAGTGTYSAATSEVTYTAEDTLSFKVAEAKTNLGVYGKNPKDLILLCGSSFANDLRQEDQVYNANYRVDADILKTGTLPPIYGIKVVETTNLDSVNSGDVAILVRKDAMVTGIRKNVFFRTDSVVEEFKKRIIIAEEVDFKAQLKNGSGNYEGIVRIKKGS